MATYHDDELLSESSSSLKSEDSMTDGANPKSTSWPGGPYTDHQQSRHLWSPIGRGFRAAREKPALLYLSSISVALNILLTFAFVATLLRGFRDPSLPFYSIDALPNIDKILTTLGPALEAVEYHSVVVDRGLEAEHTPYQGWPTDEIDRRWQDLYQDTVFLEINEQQKARLPNNTLRWSVEGHEDNWMMGLMVFHELHCLDRVRMSLHPDRYDMGIYNADGSIHHDNFIHTNHCVDLLRQSLMCHSDPNTFVFAWNPVKERMRLRFDTPHQCRRFDRIKQWAKERAFSHYDEENFVRKSGDMVPLDFGP